MDAAIAAVETLRRVWIQQYYRTETEVRWRSGEDGLPPAPRFISSPYDPEAHYAKKRTTSGVGYKVHLTESCEEGTPHLITHVETTSAPAADGEVTTSIHEALAQGGLLPSTHWSAEEKTKLVRRHLIERISISEDMRRGAVGAERIE